MNTASLFEHWRTVKRPEQSWGLAWFLASEFCRRFYASHGLVPWVLTHEGLGYYGITINQLPCSVNPSSDEALGRFTMGGDVENWRTGGPGNHGCNLMDRCASGVPTEQLILAAISHFNIPPLPAKSHLSCRHKRWGASYELCFEIATLVALQYEPGEIQIWNHPAHTKRAIADYDPNPRMKEHPGAFLFISDDSKVCIAGDGRLLDGGDQNLWVEYMSGKTAQVLSHVIIQRLFRTGRRDHAGSI